ncbi:MAG: hypothetical protein K1X79_04865 [Oligoflexia bacterium]|nr:hypothetical protein [Oligoflexia bacterium]
MRTLKFALLASLLAAQIGCGFTYRNTIGLFDSAPAKQSAFTSPATAPEPETSVVKPEPSQDTTPTTETLAQTPPSTATRSAIQATQVELLWEIPKDAVDGYIIRYGLDREKLDHVKRVPASALERFEDSKLGFVYRYVLSDVPEKSSVFVSLSAFVGEHVSTQSQVLELKK